MTLSVFFRLWAFALNTFGEWPTGFPYVNDPMSTFQWHIRTCSFALCLRCSALPIMFWRFSLRFRSFLLLAFALFVLMLHLISVRVTFLPKVNIIQFVLVLMQVGHVERRRAHCPKLISFQRFPVIVTMCCGVRSVLTAPVSGLLFSPLLLFVQVGHRALAVRKQHQSSDRSKARDEGAFQKLVSRVLVRRKKMVHD